MTKIKDKEPRRLTLKQQRFVDEYLIDGNGARAAAVAGYKGCQDVLKSIACENLTKPYIANAIVLKTAEITKKNDIKIKTRLERKAFWSKMMDDAAKDSDKLQASMLLGKSEADFALDNAGKDAGLTLVFNVERPKTEVISDETPILIAYNEREKEDVQE